MNRSLCPWLLSPACLSWIHSRVVEGTKNPPGPIEDRGGHARLATNRLATVCRSPAGCEAGHARCECVALTRRLGSHPPAKLTYAWPRHKYQRQRDSIKISSWSSKHDTVWCEQGGDKSRRRHCQQALFVRGDQAFQMVSELRLRYVLQRRSHGPVYSGLGRPGLSRANPLRLGDRRRGGRLPAAVAWLRSLSRPPNRWRPR